MSHSSRRAPACTQWPPVAVVHTISSRVASRWISTHSCAAGLAIAILSRSRRRGAQHRWRWGGLSFWPPAQVARRCFVAKHLIAAREAQACLISSCPPQWRRRGHGHGEEAAAQERGAAQEWMLALVGPARPVQCLHGQSRRTHARHGCEATYLQTHYNLTTGGLPHINWSRWLNHHHRRLWQLGCREQWDEQRDAGLR